MPVDDIRQFVEELEKAGQLKRIKTEVDTNLEIAEILRRVSYTCLLYTSDAADE